MSVGIYLDCNLSLATDGDLSRIRDGRAPSAGFDVENG